MTVPAHPHGAMRRKDREITDRAEIDAIVHAAKFMHLALADDNVPFVVPLFHAYDGCVLYFHSARAGAKIEILKRNNRVCFCVSLVDEVLASEVACDFEVKHRTAIGTGRAFFVEDEAEKRRALDAIVARFSDRKFEYPAANFAVTTVVRIEIDSLKGKKHGF